MRVFFNSKIDKGIRESEAKEGHDILTIGTFNKKFILKNKDLKMDFLIYTVNT